MIALIGSSLCVCAQNVASDDEAFDNAINQLKGDNVGREKAINTIKTLAGKGYGRALNEMGVFYATGDLSGFPQDGQKAKDFFTKAWNAKWTQAAQNLTALYLTGACCPPDTARAFEWAKKGAEAGNAVSMKDLGLFYLNPSYGMETDTVNAVGWFRKSADLECGSAMWELARFYHNKGNTQEERYWIKKGVDADDVNCLYGYGLLLWNGQNGIEEDKEAAAELFKRAADLYEFEFAAMKYADICDEKGDYATAIRYYELAADYGNLYSVVMIADYYYLGKMNTERRDSRAFNWYCRGAGMQPRTFEEQDMQEYCQSKVGLCYYLGRGVEMDRKKGSDILYQLAGRGNEEARKYIKDYNVR